MKVEFLDTPAAGKRARDCEFLSLQNDEKGLKINFHRKEDNTYWSMICYGLAAYKIIGEELLNGNYLTDLPTDGSFYEIFDSPWIEELKDDPPRIINNYKNYILKFQEHTFEIITYKLAFEKLDERPEG